MSELKVAITDNLAAFEPGEEISGAVYWKCDSAPTALELRLVWHTEGRATKDVGVPETLRFEHPMPEEGRPFKLKLPLEPYSFSGKLISILWELELVALPSNEHANLPIVIAPGRKEIEAAPTNEN